MLVNEENIFSECTNQNHPKSGSTYKRVSVPISYFVNARDGSYFAHCKDCREYIRNYKKKLDSDVDEFGIHRCGTCRKMRTVDYCEQCSKNNMARTKKCKENYHKVLWERMVELDSCCEHCNQIFLKKRDGSPGFISLKGSLKGHNISASDIDFSAVEFDHLSEEEQLKKFGVYYGPKKNGVGGGGILSYASKKREAKKCILLCLACHKAITTLRYGIRKVTRLIEQEKIDYVNRKKCEVGHCQSCKHKVDPTNLAYFEWDHIDPSKKRHTISEIATQGHALFTLVYLIDELTLCRLLCTYCHRLHTANQTKERFAWVREKNMLKSKAAFERKRIADEEKDNIVTKKQKNE